MTKPKTKKGSAANTSLQNLPDRGKLFNNN